jgi:hypothetical protein
MAAKSGASAAHAPHPCKQEIKSAGEFRGRISLFERAYLLLYEPNMSEKQRRRWHSWDDYMREWCGREDFRTDLPELLRGEDPDFSAYILRVAEEEVG